MAFNNDPTDRTTTVHPGGTNRVDAPSRRPAAYDSELQADPELTEGPASGGRIAAFAVAIAVVLGAVFYGLNNSANAPTSAQAPSGQQTATDSTSPPIRDVTPNRGEGVTTGVSTGTAPAQPQAPQSRPTGAEVDQNKGANPITDSGTR